MALKFPRDLSTWQQWQANSKPEQRVKNLLRKLKGRQEQNIVSCAVSGVLHMNHPEPELLIVLESTSPTSVVSLLRPVEYLKDSRVAVIAPINVEYLLPQGPWQVQEVDTDVLTQHRDIKVVLAAGHYLPLGAAVYRDAQKMGWEFIVVQHGLMTPFAPPLPENSTLLAFSDADGDFWRSGREDITVHTVGSQLFYEAAQKPKVDIESIDSTPVFLGQMHGAELPRLSFALAGYKFCLNHGAIYRPHPSEKDKLSLITHKLWGQRGITVDTSAIPLNEMTHPVVSIFSTGVLEAAIRGIPSWVYHPKPEPWLIEFWERYGMNRWGDSPTEPPVQPCTAPADTIARIIAEKLEK
ncbi:RNA-binding protein [Rothia sp. P13129]|uniref:RNA-binding protein n=1 Tax=Rothia sp. P13129 TaxID=3402664 RepID=UPI003ACD56BC